MQRKSLNNINPAWEKRNIENGMSFSFLEDKQYWIEDSFYEFSMKEIDFIEDSTNDIYKMCLNTIKNMVNDTNYLTKLKIPQNWFDIFQKTFNVQQGMYGRFDLAYDDKNLKMLEFNADTPTSLLEASIIQWIWLKDYFPNGDQFNSIHEKLQRYFHNMPKNILYHLTSMDSIEDFANVSYIQDVMISEGLNTKYLEISEIAYDNNNKIFLDNENQKIDWLFKLYPIECLIEKNISKELLEVITKREIYVQEPLWKLLLSNKLFLVELYKQYPNNSLILKAFETPEYFIDNKLPYVAKPIYSREGADILIYDENNRIISSNEVGHYNKNTYIYQEYIELPKYVNNQDNSIYHTNKGNGNVYHTNKNNNSSIYPIIGSWIVDEEACGIGIREDSSIITQNTSCFVPHMIN